MLGASQGRINEQERDRRSGDTEQGSGRGRNAAVHENPPPMTLRHQVKRGVALADGQLDYWSRKILVAGSISDRREYLGSTAR
jgi:hypothetical protein